MSNFNVREWGVGNDKRLKYYVYKIDLDIENDQLSI